jgi:hypothetical protein
MKLWRTIIILVFSLNLLVAACIPSTPVPTPTPTLAPTMTPTPTHTPTPTSTLAPTMTSTPTPAPRAHISAPTDGQGVPPNAEVVVEYSNIPQDHYLWVVVRIPSIHPKTWWIYPQLYENKVPSHWVGSGMLTTNAALGGPRDTGAPFNVVVLLVGQEANRSFVEYANHCGPVPTTCTGMPLPETEIEILDFTTVIRK